MTIVRAIVRRSVNSSTERTLYNSQTLVAADVAQVAERDTTSKEGELDRSDLEVGVVALPQEQAENGCDDQAEDAAEVEEVLGVARSLAGNIKHAVDTRRTKTTRTMMTIDSTRKSQLSVAGPDARSEPTELKSRAHSIDMVLRWVYWDESAIGTSAKEEVSARLGSSSRFEVVLQADQQSPRPPRPGPD